MLKKKAATSCKKHSETEAVWYCKKCKRYMCEKCKTAHDDFHGDDNHNVVPAASLASFDLLSGKCAEHDRDLDFICNDCEGTSLVNCFIYLYFYILRTLLLHMQRKRKAQRA